jgi:carboxy-terminal domain RNA polymerase II polypeptide A small phosphatase
LVEALEEVIPSLVTTLEQLSQDDLLTFDQILERKLFEIDRAEVQEQDHFRTGDYIVLKRPNVSTFIETLFEWFDVSVWTAGSSPYAHADCLKFIMTSKNTVWKYDFEIREHRVMKPLKKVTRKGFELSKILHIDNTPSTFSTNNGNGILVSSWTGQQNDDELLSLLTFLEFLGPLQDVRKVEKRGWQTRLASWSASAKEE